MFFAFLLKKFGGVNINTIFVGVMITILAAIVLPNLGAINKWFNKETREELVESRQQARANTEVAVDAAKSNGAAVKTLEGTLENTQVAIVGKVENDTKIDKTVTSIGNKAKKKIEDIGKAKLTPEEAQTQVSAVQITSIWDTFCSQNTSSQCAANASPQGA